MTKNQVNILTLILLGLFGIYVLWRGIFIPMTIDECVTFNIFRSSPWSDVFEYIPATANNHLLNTIWVKLMAMNFNYQEWILRLPNLLAFFLYAFYAFKIFHLTLKNEWKVLLATIFFVSNPYLIEFFALARGYGLSLDFMMTSLYFLLKYHQKEEKNIHFALFFAILSVLSNFSMLNFYLGLVVALGLESMLKKNWKVFLPLFLWTIALGAIIFNPIAKMKKAGELYFGGEKGFFEDTVISLVQNTTFSENVENIRLFSIFLASLVSFSLVYILYQRLSGLKALTTSDIFPFSIGIILLISILSPIVQFYLLGNKFLIQRTALLYIPLVVLLLVFSLDFIQNSRFSLAILAIFCFFSLYNFSKNANTKQVREWDFDKYSKNVLQFLAQNDHKTPEKKLRLAAHPLFVQSLNFYMLQQKIDWIERVPDEPLQKHPDFDYYYIRKEDSNQVPQNAQPVMSFEEGNFVLLKR